MGHQGQKKIDEETNVQENFSEFFLFNIMAAAITFPSDLIKRGEIAILAISVHPNEILLVGLP